MVTNPPSLVRSYTTTMFNLFQTSSNDAKCKNNYYDHSTKTKKCEHCGQHAKSNSAQQCWSCKKKYERRTEKKSNDMRGRVYKICSKCGLMAKSNRQSRCHNEECKHVFEKSQKTNKKKVSKKRKKSGSKPPAKKTRLEDELMFDADLFNFDDNSVQNSEKDIAFRKTSPYGFLLDDDDKFDPTKFGKSCGAFADVHQMSANKSDSDSFLTSFAAEVPKLGRQESLVPIAKSSTEKVPKLERQESLVPIAKAPKLTRVSSIVFSSEEPKGQNISEDEISDLITEFFANETEEDKFIFD